MEIVEERIFDQHGDVYLLVPIEVTLPLDAQVSHCTPEPTDDLLFSSGTHSYSFERKARQRDFDRRGKRKKRVPSVRAALADDQAEIAITPHPADRTLDELVSALVVRSDDVGSGDRDKVGITASTTIAAHTEEAVVTPRQYVRILVHSRILACASTYFSRMFFIEMLEASQLREGNHAQLTLDDLNSRAITILMDIFHCKTRKVPQHIDLDLLTNIAVAVDYLDCHEAVEMWTNQWVQQLDTTVTSEWNAQTLQWLCIASVFGRRPLLSRLMGSTSRKLAGPMSSRGLPIPIRVIGTSDIFRFHPSF